MAIMAVSFDADQTLWDFRGVQRTALRATVDEMVCRGDAQEGRVDEVQLQTVRDQVAVRYRGRPHSLEDVREQSFAIVLRRLGHRDPEGAARSLVAFYLDIRFGKIALYPEVNDSLGRLKRQYKLGLLTNGNTDPNRSGLTNTFDAVVMGPDHGFEKPDPRLFGFMAHALDVDIESIAHIGDSWDDVDGAN